MEWSPSEHKLHDKHNDAGVDVLRGKIPRDAIWKTSLQSCRVDLPGIQLQRISNWKNIIKLENV